MDSGVLSLERIYEYFIGNGGKVKNRDVVRYFKNYLTDPYYKDNNRAAFKEYINFLSHSKVGENGEKVLVLKSKYHHSLPQMPPSLPTSPLSLSNSYSSLNASTSSLNDPRITIGIPTSPPPPPPPTTNNNYIHSSSPHTPQHRQPPPYRNPPPVPSPSNTSFDSDNQQCPQVPPRRKNTSEIDDKTDPQNNNEEMLSVRERTQHFNRMASQEDELSPRVMKSAEKDRSKNWTNEEEVAPVTPVSKLKCQEWYVTASRGDCQELMKLARAEPRLVNKKDPFTSVLHWGAKYGNQEIIKIFAGKYKVDVNGRTNGGYTPLHIASQFGHKDVFKLLIQVFNADPNIRDFNGRTADYYFVKEQDENKGITLRKVKGRKKQSDKDLGFLRIGSLNVKVKKTTEAVSNFLGGGNWGTTNNSARESLTDKGVHKGWGSADNVNKQEKMSAPKDGYVIRKKSKRVNGTTITGAGATGDSGASRSSLRNLSSTSLPLTTTQDNESDSDSAAGFDSHWKN